MRKYSLAIAIAIAMTHILVLPQANAATVYSFTVAGASGRNGPTQAQVTTAYSGGNLAGAVTVSTQGIQLWTVPTSGNYQINAIGAGGGGARGGNGASITGTFNLTSGTILKIVVGQTGTQVLEGSTNYRYGGGGGSFVTNSANVPYVVAGGGGGAAITGGSYLPAYGGNGSTNPNPGVTTGGAAGSGTTGCGGQGQGGAGFDNNGSGVNAALSFTNNAVGGGSGADQCVSTIGGSPFGGFGGGGAGGNGGGAGGGYYGGTGGDSTNIGGQFDSGDGGGSYNNGTSQTNVVANNRNAHGSVTITLIAPPVVSLVIAGNAATSSKGSPIVLTFNTDTSGFVTFYADRKRIAGCINLATSIGNKTCPWKPTGQRVFTVYATLSQSGAVVASSPNIQISIEKRTNNR